MLLTADLMMVVVIILILVFGLLTARRGKKDVVDPLIQAQQHPHIQVVYPTPPMRVVPPELVDPMKRSLPAGDVVEGQFREL